MENSSLKASICPDRATWPPTALPCNVFFPEARNLGSEPMQRLTGLFLSHCFIKQHCDFLWSMSTGALTRMEPIYLISPDSFIAKRWVKRQFIKVQIMIRALAWNGRLDLPKREELFWERLACLWFLRLCELSFSL